MDGVASDRTAPEAGPGAVVRPSPSDGSEGQGTSRIGARDAGLLALIATVWGFNFIPIQLALDQIPPFALTGLRFLLAAFPLVFVVRRPTLPLSLLVAYGVAVGVFQFGLLFLAIGLGLAAGLASLLMQLQMFFTVGLAAVLTGDRMDLRQAGGGVISLVGLGVLAWSLLQGGAGVTALSLILILAASFSWAVGNILVKVAAKTSHFDMFALVIWSSLVVPIPLGVLSFWFEGGWQPLHDLLAADPLTWACVLFMSYGATVFGYSMWNRMLRRHPAGVVTPFTMLVPVVGLAGGILVLHETLLPAQLLGAVILFVGIGVAVLRGPGSGLRPSVRVSPHSPPPPPTRSPRDPVPLAGNDARTPHADD